jgi:hypothetical protein
MVTTVIKTIKPAGGGDYSSLVSWESVQRGNLVTRDTVEVAEVYGGGSAGAVVLASANWTVDATHYPWIRAASGQGHNGVFNASNAYVTGGFAVTLFDIAVGYTKIGPGISCQVNQYAMGVSVYAVGNCIVDGLLMRPEFSSGATAIAFANNVGTVGNIVRNCGIHLGSDGTSFLAGAYLQSNSGNPATLSVLNCTIHLNNSAGNNGCIMSYGFPTSNLGIITTQNCYFTNPAGTIYGVNVNWPGQFVKGTHDATSNTEAITPSLQNIAYSTANFVNITTGSEDLHLKAGSALLLKGISLVDVTTDFEGTSRVGFIYDIGADQFDQVPMCWNYTARYRSSNKLFKASGCGNYPKSLRVPSNIDKSTGRMVDDGIEIDPSEYEIV